MRIKITLLATLFTLLIGFQTAQAQRRGTYGKDSKVEYTSPNALSVSSQVQGTITVAGPLTKKVSALQCSDIVVQIGQNETPKSGLQLTLFKVVASGKATGNISTGKCGYAIRNPSGLAVNMYTIRVVTYTNAECPYALDLNSDNQSLQFPTGEKVETRDFTVKPSCLN